MREKGQIDWNYEGKTDFSSGTGAYFEEKVLGIGSAFILPIVLIVLLSIEKINWSIPQIILGLILAFDISGGVVSNALNSCKRFYHTPPKQTEGKLGKVLKNPFLFCLFHIHPIIVALMFHEWSFSTGLVWYGLFLMGVVGVMYAPLYLKRPLSILLIMLALIINFYVLIPVTGLEWLMPLLFLKILYGHLVQEEPYRKK